MRQEKGRRQVLAARPVVKGHAVAPPQKVITACKDCALEYRLRRKGGNHPEPQPGGRAPSLRAR